MCARCKRKTFRQLSALALAPGLLIAQPQLPDMSHSKLFSGLAKPVISWIGPEAALAAEAKTSTSITKDSTKWTCPMHPHYIADEFGSCPICGMDLVKLETGGQGFNAEVEETRSAITVDPEVIQNIGVRLGKVENANFGRSVRSYGIVRENERLQTEITARVEGWVEKLHVTAVGDEVEAGTTLFELYSPQLVVSQNDYLKAGSDKLFKERGFAQLRALGVQPRTIELIKKQKEPLQLVPFYAERDGVVSRLELKQGSYTKRGMILAMIQDYSSVWLHANVAEKDLGFISKETSATVTFPNLSGRTVKGKVDYIYPTVDTKTRTGQVRLVIDNADGKIRPGAYADISFDVGVENRTAVPTEAVLQNGQGKYVVVSLGEGRFESRLVETGLVSNRWTEITNGVQPGDNIVVSGQFLIDSESALRESFRKLEQLQLPTSLLNLTKSQFAMIDHFVDAAIYIHEALVDGYDVENSYLDPAISVRDLMWPRFKNTKLSFVLNDATEALRNAKLAESESELQSALAQLTGVLRQWILEGAPRHYKSKQVALFTDIDSGQTWIQLEGKPINPYSRGEAELVPWPVSNSEQKRSEIKPAKSIQFRSNLKSSEGGSGG